jgi:hypothetical protein
VQKSQIKVNTAMNEMPQTTTFVMDLNSGPTQTLSDSTYDYIYGNGRIAQGYDPYSAVTTTGGQWIEQLWLHQ